MHANTHSMLVNWGLNLARLAGVLSLFLGAVVLLGWYLREPALIQVNPAFVPMQYNTALGFALGGLALMGLAWRWPRIAWITGIIVLLTGVLTLVEYGFRPAGDCGGQPRAAPLHIRRFARPGGWRS